MQIVPLPDNKDIHRQMAELLVEGFKVHWDAWKTVAEGLEEIQMVRTEGFIRVALDDTGKIVLGWIGGLPEYDGNVWELHPMVVRAEYQKQGIGRALITDFEAQIKTRGGLTIHLGTDDEDSMTSLANCDLYDNLPERIAHIQNFKGHPYEFYQKCGYKITGVVPDANGRGKPDIIMSKCVY
ncbi:MAG: GNAT family N-acetyltransferase [Anaerolineaceae bacterium]|nr:GNAT family N-acetyltransferase [Anaerolineaceae bacterium]